MAEEGWQARQSKVIGRRSNLIENSETGNEIVGEQARGELLLNWNHGNRSDRIFLCRQLEEREVQQKKKLGEKNELLPVHGINVKANSTREPGRLKEAPKP